MMAKYTIQYCFPEVQVQERKLIKLEDLYRLMIARFAPRLPNSRRNNHVKEVLAIVHQLNRVYFLLIFLSFILFFHSIVISLHSIPFHSIPFHSIQFHWHSYTLSHKNPKSRSLLLSDRQAHTIHNA